MNFEPTPKQLEYLNAVFSNQYSFLTYGGAMGGGKSFIGFAILIILCRFHPNSKWIVIRESMPTLRRTSLDTFKKIVPSNFLKDFNQQSNVATFTNGSRIEFMAEDWYNDKDFDRFKGIECNGFLLEQIEELNEGLLDVCFIRAGRNKIPSNPKPIILANVNPTQAWPKRRIYDAYNKGQLPTGWYYLPATIFDNPTLANDADYMNSLKTIDPVTYKRLIDGDWDAFAVDKPFLYCFDTKIHVSTEAVWNENLTTYLSFDFNVDPAICVVSQSGSVDGKQFIYFVDEVFLNDSNIYAVCEVIKSKFPNAHFLVTGDASGRNRNHMQKGNINSYTIIKQELILKDAQFKLPGANPPLSESRTLCNSILSRFPKILFHPEKCKRLIDDCTFTQVDEDGVIDTKGNKHRGHLLDGFRYQLNTFHHNFVKRS